jgi:hypothetical protein
MFSDFLPDESRLARVRQWARYGSPVAERMRAAFSRLSSGDARVTASLNLIAVLCSATLAFMLSPQPPAPGAPITGPAPVAELPTAPVKIVGAEAPKGNCADQVWPYIEPRCLTRAGDAAKPDSPAAVAATPTAKPDLPAPTAKPDASAAAANSPAATVAQLAAERTTTGKAPAEPAALPGAVMNDSAAAPAKSRSATASLTLPRRVGFGAPRGAMVAPAAASDRRATQQTAEEAWAGQAMEQLMEQPRQRERRRHHRSERGSFFSFPF